MREWVVILQARSTVRLKDDEILHIEASPQSTVPLVGIRLRNRLSNLDGKVLVTGLIAEARGMAEDATGAVAFLAPHAAPYLQLAATGANGAVDEPKGLLVYAPPSADDLGRFLEQRPCSPSFPAAIMRSVGTAELGPLIGHLLRHPDEERIHRSMAHYRQALNALDPFNQVMSAEHLYMAVENLGQVVFRRLCREAGMAVSEVRVQMGANKHHLAVAAGFIPVGTSREHLYNFDAHVRVDHIFDGDRKLYKDLQETSDAFEHGYGSFGEVQAGALSSVDRAFGCVRRAILREIGVTGGSALLGTKFEHPLGGWQPTLEVAGTFISDRDEEWPHFYGTSLFPEIVAIEDIDDDQRRVTFKATATGESLLEGQQLTVESTRWSVAVKPDRNVEVGESDVVLTRADVER
jgi:hypothetical protein